MAGPSNERENFPMVNFLAGGIGNSLAKSIVAPLQRVVVVMQLDSNSRQIIPTVKTILQRDGLRGFFRGNLTMVVHRFPYSGIQLLTYDRCKHAVREYSGGNESTFFMKFLAGGVSGSVATGLCFPLDVVRTRLMSPNSDYHGILPTLTRIIRDEGARGLYKGLMPTLLQRIPDLCLHFSVYETARFWLLKNCSDTLGSQGCTLGASSVAGLASVTSTIPLDIIRRRMMMDGAGGSVRKYKNLLDCGLTIFREQGPVGLYRGYTVELSRVVPQVCLSWFLIEEFRYLLGAQSS